MRKATKVVAIAAIGIAAGPVLASSVSAPMAVSITVENACTVSPATMDFGTGMNGATTNVNVFMTLNCASGVAYNVAMDAGLHYDGSFRRMTDDNGGYVQYTISKPDFSGDWGDSDAIANTYPAGTSVSGVGTGSDTTLQVNGSAFTYGRPPGSYSDTVTISVLF